MILHGRDDFGIQKSGFLWKHSRNTFKPWKQYYFVLTRLCLICYHRGSNGIQGKNPKLKIELNRVASVEVVHKKGSVKKRHRKQFLVSYGGKKSQLHLKSEEEDVTAEWVKAIQDATQLCTTREKVHVELRRASFKLNVEQNLQDKFFIHSGSVRADLPRITYLNRTPWDERIRSVHQKADDIQKEASSSRIALSPEKRCYTYNENIVLSTPDISLSQINNQSRQNSFRLHDSHTGQDSNSQFSKSFSCDDVMLSLTVSADVSHKNYDRNGGNLAKTTPGLTQHSIATGHHQQSIEETKSDDGDSGQGSDELNHISDNEDPNQISNFYSQSLPSKMSYRKSNLKNQMSNCNRNYYFDSQQLKQGVDIHKDTQNTAFSQATFSRSRKNWSSELDLVPEEKELGLFSPRYQQPLPPKQHHRYNRNMPTSVLMRNGPQQWLRSTDAKGSMSLPSYGHHSYGFDRENIHANYDSDTCYERHRNNGYPIKDSQNSFGRENKFYHSLDPSYYKQTRQLMYDNKKGHFNRNKPQDDISYHQENQQWNTGRCWKENDQGFNMTNTKTPQTTSTTRYYTQNTASHLNTSRKPNYHGYEESETDFSGPDEDFQVPVRKPHPIGGVRNTCASISRLYSIGREALPCRAFGPVYYV